MIFYPIKFYDSDYADINTIYKSKRSWEHIIVAYGNNSDGIPGCIIINNINSPIYVRGYTKHEIKEKLREIKVFDYTIIKKYMKGFDHYEKDKSVFYGICPKSFKMRKKICDAFDKVYNLPQSYKDLHCVVFGLYDLHPSVWWKLDNPIKKSTIYGKFTYEVNINRITETEGPIDKKMRVGCWDIETRSYNSSKPQPYQIEPNKNGAYDVMFMISFSLKWYNGENIGSWVLTTKETEETDKTTIIKCESQKDLTVKFLKLLAKYKPNILYDFNGMNFDWQFIDARVKFYNIDIYKIFNVKRPTGSYNSRIFDHKFDTRSKIKIESNKNIEGTTFTTCDCICMDLLPLLKREFDYSNGPKANFRRLNEFLADNGLALKYDLPYHIMNKYYDNDNKEGMTEAAIYCKQDAEALFALSEKRLFLEMAEETSNSSYVQLHSYLYRANTFKLQNAIMKEARDKGYLFRTKYSSSHSVGEGAIVISPDRGLHNYNSFDYDLYSQRLKEEIDMKTDEFVYTSREETKNYIKDLDLYLQNICYEALKQFPPPENIQPWIASRPVFALDFSSLYPSSDREGNLCPSTISKNPMPDFREQTFLGQIKYINRNEMGIIPTFLDRKYHERMEVKKASWAAEDPYQAKLLGVKEKMLKIGLNSVYGSFGDSNNRYFYNPYIQTGIVQYSRMALIVAKIIAEHLGCVVRYGDTDSIYSSFPNEYFEECDNIYSQSNKTYEDIVQYWKSMVEITIKNSKFISDKINEYFISITGNKFYRIVYEETGGPVLWITKKNYIMVVHEKEFNKEFFDRVFRDKERDYKYISKNILEKGVATRKRDRSDFTKHRFLDIVLECFHPMIKQSRLEIIENFLKNLNANQDNIEQFKLQALYKSSISDTDVKRVFARRMKRMYDYEMSDLEYFDYYVIKRDFDLDGKRITKIGDKMLLAQFYNGEEIDKDYYTCKIIGTVSRLIINYPGIYDNDGAKRYLKSVVKSKRNKGAETRAYKKVKNINEISNYNIFKHEMNIDLMDESKFLTELMCDLCEEHNRKAYESEKISIYRYSFHIPDKGFSQEVIDMVDKITFFSEKSCKRIIKVNENKLTKNLTNLVTNDVLVEQSRYYNYIKKEKKRCLENFEKGEEISTKVYKPKIDISEFHQKLDIIENSLIIIILMKALINKYNVQRDPLYNFTH